VEMSIETPAGQARGPAFLELEALLPYMDI
jgi:hypothetical protein